ncbi:MAG: phage holin [Eubacteriales bacterium]|nr:phage holin [Eubacteriales bacterium]
MKLPDKIYDILKWITMVVIPACATAYVGLAAVWVWPCADEVAKTAAVVCTLLGALLGISTAQYNKSERSIGKHELPGDPYATLKNEMASSDDDASFF